LGRVLKATIKTAKLKFKKGTMFRQNVIKVYILIFASIGVTGGCKKNEAEITDLSDMPVLIKFDIPETLIPGEEVSPEKERRVYLKITAKYSGLSKINRVHFKNFSDTLSYYEYTGQSKKGDVLIFVFESAQAIAVSGFTSNATFLKETRFKFTNTGLELYKRTLGKGQRTVSIFFRTNDKLISFNKDDGFSAW
jgi:hypothetical protein